MSHREDLKTITKALNNIKNNDVLRDAFKKYEVDLDELDLVPFCFDDDLDVSARTDHAIIYLNGQLRNAPEEIPHYLVHELTHYLQQTTGTKPTKGSDAGNYLDNKEEIEGFQNQTEFIAETEGDKDAEQYVDQVLDHHKVIDDKEREKRKKKLLQIASIISK